jgi:GntR family transcriptional regulator
MNIDFILSKTDSRPMYQQVMARIKEHIAIGDWPEGTKLPSIRELAAALKVSVITIKRAYQDLEQEGSIVTRQGKGCFVAASQEDQHQRITQELDHHLEQAIKIAARLGLNDQEFAIKVQEIRDTVTERI